MRTTAAVGVGNTTGRLIAFLFMVILAGVMSADAYGRVRYVLSVATLASTAVAGGLPSAMTRFLARNKDNPREKDTYFSNITLIFIVFFIITEIAVYILDPHEPIVLVVVLGYSMPLLYMGILRGLMQYTKFASMSLLRNSIKLLILIVLIYLSGVTENYALLIYSFGGWVAILILELIYPAKLHLRKEYISKEKMKEITLFSIPVLITTLAFATITQVPNIVLRRYMGYDSVAVFSIAYTVTLLYAFVPFAVLTIAMPEIASVKSMERRINLFLSSSALIIVTGTVLLILTIIFGKWGLHLIFKGKYDSAFDPLVILSIGAILLGIRNAYSALWEGGGRPIFSMYDTIGGALSTLIFSYILIPEYGVCGAAWSFVLGSAVSVSISTYFLIRMKKGHIKLK